MRFLLHFLTLLRGMLIWRRFWDDFRGARRGKNEQKCGRVCSDSLFSVRNIRSISDAFSAGFWEGLGSILGGFSAAKSEKVALQSDLKRKPKNKAIKSHAGIPR